MSPTKILVTCIHYPVASGRYIVNALRRMGYDVRSTGPQTGANIWGITVKDIYAWQPDSLADGWQPDLWIHADSAYTVETDLHPAVVWGVDNHVRDYKGHDYDALFLAHSWGARMTEPNAHWLPCAYDPQWFFNTHNDERDIDVAILGYPYAERQEIVTKMLAAGLKVHYGIGAVYDEYNEIYNRAKIALVRSINSDLAQRFFENMAQGCCVLTDYTPDAIRLGFTPYIDYWVYQTPEDATASAQWLITSGKWWDVAVNGERKVKPHTWDARAQQLLQTMELSQ